MVENEELFLFYVILRVLVEEEYTETEESDTKEKHEDGSIENQNDDIV